jgi:hypothetical protein
MRANLWISIPMGVAIPVLMALFTYWLNHHNEWWNQDVDSRVTSALTQKGGIQDTLGQVRDTVNRTHTSLDDLKPFILDIVDHQFENVSKLPTAALQQRLPAVQHLLAVAKDQGFKAYPPTLDALSHNLSTVETEAADF